VGGEGRGRRRERLPRAVPRIRPAGLLDRPRHPGLSPRCRGRGFELQGESILPWLATICRFQAANRLRQRRRDQANTADAADETIPSTISVEEQVITTDLAERIAAEVGTMSALDREIFRLCAAEGYAYQAAAEELGISHAVVRNRLSRVRIRLRGAVKEASEA